MATRKARLMESRPLDNGTYESVFVSNQPMDSLTMHAEVVVVPADVTLWRDNITTYHEDGTDYINDELEAKVREAIERCTAPIGERNLAPIAAIRTVMDWLEVSDGD